MYGVFCLMDGRGFNGALDCTITIFDTKDDAESYVVRLLVKAGIIQSDNSGLIEQLSVNGRVCQDKEDAIYLA